MPNFPQSATDILDAASAEQATATLCDAPELAVDVEADSMHAFHARLCYVQVGTDREVLLFDTLSPGVQAQALKPLFEDPARVKYFHAAGGDLQFLAEAGVRVKNLFDTHRAATLLGWPKVGLADLVRERLGVELKKEHQQADFAIRPLPPELREYISDDVRYLCEIGRQVMQACRDADILEEVSLDCARIADEAAVRPDLTEFRAKIPREGLSTAQIKLATATAKQLHLLRLQWAEQANVPMGRMLSNAALAEIATRFPADLKALGRLQGVRGPFVRQYGAPVLELLRQLAEKAQRGELPEEDDARGPRDPGRRKREEALKQFRHAKATERKVTASVVLPNPLADALAQRPPQNEAELASLPYFGEKRLRLYGEELVALLSKL